MSGVKKIQNKITQKEAIQLTPFSINEVEEFVGGDLGKNENGDIVIATLEGPMICSMNDYIIKGIQGEFYPCKPDVFENSYEIIN